MSFAPVSCYTHIQIRRCSFSCNWPHIQWMQVHDGCRRPIGALSGRLRGGSCFLLAFHLYHGFRGFQYDHCHHHRRVRGQESQSYKNIEHMYLYHARAHTDRPVHEIFPCVLTAFFVNPLGRQWISIKVHRGAGRQEGETKVAGRCRSRLARVYTSRQTRYASASATESFFTYIYNVF